MRHLRELPTANRSGVAGSQLWGFLPWPPILANQSTDGIEGHEHRSIVAEKLVGWVCTQGSY